VRDLEHCYGQFPFKFAKKFQLCRPASFLGHFPQETLEIDFFVLSFQKILEFLEKC